MQIIASIWRRCVFVSFRESSRPAAVQHDDRHFVFVSLPLPLAPVPGTPVSGEPTVPGPPDVPVFGALPELPDVGPDVELPEPGMTPRPGAPDVAVPTEPDPEVVGRSVWLLTEPLVLPDALVFDFGETLPDAPVSLDAGVCAWAYEPRASAVPETRTKVIRENSAFIMLSTRRVIQFHIKSIRAVKHGRQHRSENLILRQIRSSIAGSFSVWQRCGRGKVL